jgi:large subunit ribosomal protein L18e
VKKVKSTGPTNPNVQSIRRYLRRSAHKWHAKIWKDIDNCLQRPRRRSVQVNLSKISRLTKQDDIIVIPGKVLSAGKLLHHVTVAALDFSRNAREKILAIGGKCLTLKELIKQNPKGSNIKIIT